MSLLSWCSLSAIAVVAVQALAWSDPAAAQTPELSTSQTQLPRIDVTVQRARPKRAPRRQTTQPAPQPQQDVPATTTAGQTNQGQPTDAASAQVVSGERVNAQPNARSGEVLEITPGLIVTQHSGEGKANQYFLRGFNLDHGTDFAITVDGMPVNMRTHGHGQGYADINFLIPELIQSLQIRKGPYFADEGDFSSAGTLHIDYIDRLDPGLALVTIGSFNYKRALAAKSFSAFAGNLLVAVEATGYDGPWDVPDRARKWNGVMRYSQGTATDGVAVTFMGYDNHWNSTDQIPERAVTSGLIDRFGTLDPTDGGDSSRYSLSVRSSQSSAFGVTKVDAYVIRSTLTLFNNFTYFLNDPVNGDQFSQTDRRTIMGFNGSHIFEGRLGPFDSETRIGIQNRYDTIDVGLVKTFERMTLSTVRQDNVTETSLGIYAQNTTRWTDWMRSVVGVRGDQFWAAVRSDTPQNSGDAAAFIASPKAGMVFGPFAKTELFLNAGTGFHSNDVRGVTIKVDPVDKITPLDSVPFLVRAKGAEVGARTKAIPGLESSVALFVLTYDSELLFVGDAGTTEPSRPSRRVGVEWTNHYTPVPWLAFDFDVAMTRARFTDFDPVGDFIPGAPNMVVSAGVVLGNKTGWFGAIKVRYFGPRPLIEDNSVRSDPTTLVNARWGYKFDNGLRIQLDAVNLFNVNASQVDYYYTSRLPGEPPDGVADRHFHPVEPLAVRLTVAGNF